MKTIPVNPVWMREMRQAARLTRTPLILAAITAIAGLTVCAVGGIAAQSAPPAEVGVVLFHTFFSIAFAVVAWVGPGVAALTIVSERAGRTWEAVVLTGITPRDIARGKFLAALTYIGLYLVALLPVGALPFLFGGITATEVVIAYVLLAVFATLATGFGLAVSSGAPSPALALLVTLPVAVGVSLFAYFGLGVGLSVAAHELWPGIAQGAPVWLPTAYVRADFGAEYVLYLLALPVLLVAVLSSLFFELTAANLADASDDRSSGLKRWFLLSLAGVTLLGALAAYAVSTSRWVITLSAQSVASNLSLFALFALALDPPGPSRRIQARWERESTGALARFLGPGMARTQLLLALGTALSQVVLAATGYFAEMSASADRGRAGSPAIVAAYGSCFFVFLAGFSTLARTVPEGKLKPRALLTIALFVATAGPLFAVAILGVTRGNLDDWEWVMSPSPTYVAAMIAQLQLTSLTRKPAVFLAGAVAMGFWAVLGIALGFAGKRRLPPT